MVMRKQYEYYAFVKCLTYTVLHDFGPDTFFDYYSLCAGFEETRFLLKHKLLQTYQIYWTQSNISCEFHEKTGNTQTCIYQPETLGGINFHIY